MDKLNKTVEQIASVIEQQVDEEIHRLDNLKVDDLEELREQRIKAMKLQAEQKRNWLAQGHGIYTEIPEEKNFFEVSKKSERVVCHFYRDNSPRCKILDMHLKILADKHIETRFVSINAPKCLFLAEKLKIIILPTILILRHNKVVDRIEGFKDLGNRDDFDTSMLEWRLARGNAINYEGDLFEPPEVGKKVPVVCKSKVIRDGDFDDSDLSD